MSFNVEKVTADLVKWIQDFFEENGKGCNAVLGISGGKDSSVAAALCVKALGKERVFGVLMPNGTQSDIDVSVALCEFLDIKNVTINIADCFNGLVNEIESKMEFSHLARVNLPPRLRMTTLYTVAAAENRLVAGTGNKSEYYMGYFPYCQRCNWDHSPPKGGCRGECPWRRPG